MIQNNRKLTDYPEYSVHRGMLDRCFNINSVNYSGYGGRGITVCDQWKNSFINFYNDVGPRPSPDHSIDRIDNDGSYEPGNCKWSTKKEQSNNRRNTTYVYIPKYPNKLNINEASEILGINKNTLHTRLSKGRSITDKVNTKSKGILYNGEIKPIYKIAEENNISRDLLYNRVYKGIDVNEAITAEHNVVKYLYKGTKLTVPEIAALTNLKDFNIRHHLRKGLSIANVLSLLLDGNVSMDCDLSNIVSMYLYNNRYHSVKSLSSISGLPVNVISDRIVSGMSIEQLMKQPLRVVTTYDAFGSTYTAEQIYKNLCISRQTFYRGIQTGLTAEEIIWKYHK